MSGPLVIIGGNEDKSGPQVILRRLVRLVRSSSRPPAIGIITTASHEHEQAYAQYAAVFDRLGIRTVQDLSLTSRAAACDPDLCEKISRLAALFFTGGDQLRSSSLLGGTLFHRTLLAEHGRGLVVAGTSAGASMMSDTMIVAGDAEQAPTRNTVEMAPGMGLWPGTVIDQHFSQRGRIGRLLSALAQNPGILAIGLDEDTAIAVHCDAGFLEVVGSRTVTILDGRPVEQTNASESTPRQPLALTYVTLHVLPHGYGFDVIRRRPVCGNDHTREASSGGNSFGSLLSRS
jgi:cyanophycinase